MTELIELSLQNGQIMDIADLQSQLGPFTDEGPEGREEQLKSRSSILPMILDLSQWLKRESGRYDACAV
jgi:hypothetical protein